MADASSPPATCSPPISWYATDTSAIRDPLAARDDSSASSFILSELEYLCARCSHIDFEEIFQRKVRLDWESIALDLKASPEQLKASDCALCQLFGSVSPPDFDGTDARIPLCQLRIFSANKVFARLKTFECHDIGDTTLLGVVRVNIGSDYYIRGDSRQVYRGLEETGYLCPVATGRQSPHFGVRLICPESFDVGFSNYCIAYCQKNHGPACNPRHTEPIEFFRVIDCRARRIVRAPPDCQYVALSYVWGSVASERLIAETSSESVPNEAPKVINDSIDVTFKLQLQYLWIDRYCINQSDEQDKHNQIRQMDLIYANAKVTIIAVAGEGPDHGLPGVNGTPRMLQPNLKIGGHHIASTLSSAGQLVSTSKWSSRGWTYQEGLLSKRRLIFTDQQVLWECNSMHCTESIALPLDVMHTKRKERFKADVPRGAFIYKTPGDKPWKIMSYVGKYNERQLTSTGDKLNAMQGIFRSISKARRPVFQFMGVPILPPFAAFHGGTYYKPVQRPPVECFLIGLSWYHDKPGDRQPQFPSWSWVGWAGELGNSLLFRPEWLVRLNNIRVWIEDDSKKLLSFPDFESLPNFLSQTRYGHRFILIEALTFQCSIIHRPQDSLHGKVEGWFNRPKNEYYVIPVRWSNFIYAEFMPDRKLDHTRVTESGLLGKTCTGILLGDLSGQTRDIIALVVEEMGEYAERVGIVKLDYSMYEWNGGHWDHVWSNPFPKWLQETSELQRTIRLG